MMPLLLLAATPAPPATLPAPPATLPALVPTLQQMPVNVPTVEFDVPTDKGPQSVQSHTREFATGGSSGWHTHPGVEMGIVISGEMELRLADGTVRRFGPGQTFIVPRGTIHNGVNVAPGPSRMAITYVYDKGQPVRTRVSPPEAK